MGKIDVEELLKAGVHFGHRVSRWNPKMARYIFDKRHQIHIIDLRETIRGLVKARLVLNHIIGTLGDDVMFVGTKRQARATVRQESQRCEMHYVAERWLGGVLTNFETVRRSLHRLEELESMERDGSMAALGKKMVSALQREKRKLLVNLEGIRRMDRLPGALIVVDPHREDIAVREARKLGIPTIALIDTDSDPDMVDVSVPGNDDSIRSIRVILTYLADAVVEGKAAREQAKEETSKEELAEVAAKVAPAARKPDSRSSSKSE